MRKEVGFSLDWHDTLHTDFLSTPIIGLVVDGERFLVIVPTDFHAIKKII